MIWKKRHSDNLQCEKYDKNVYCCLFSGISRHDGRLLILEYEGDGPIDQTILLVGKVSNSDSR